MTTSHPSQKAGASESTSARITSRTEPAEPSAAATSPSRNVWLSSGPEATVSLLTRDSPTALPACHAADGRGSREGYSTSRRGITTTVPSGSWCTVTRTP